MRADLEPHAAREDAEGDERDEQDRVRLAVRRHERRDQARGAEEADGAPSGDYPFARGHRSKLALSRLTHQSL
jgi:hypothetical protein